MYIYVYIYIYIYYIHTFLLSLYWTIASQNQFIQLSIVFGAQPVGQLDSWTYTIFGFLFPNQDDLDPWSLTSLRLRSRLRSRRAPWASSTWSSCHAQSPWAMASRCPNRRSIDGGALNWELNGILMGFQWWLKQPNGWLNQQIWWYSGDIMI